MTTGPPRVLVHEHNEFALALYARLRPTPGNVVFSPFSIRTGLATVCAGAKGDTATQMRSVLRLGAPGEAAYIALAELRDRLVGERPTYQLRVASSLWAHATAPIESRFLDVVTRDWGVEVAGVDFVDAEGARLRINDWVARMTQPMIQNFLTPGSVSVDTRLVLVNAVYFSGRWRAAFEAPATRMQPFFLDSQASVRVPMMQRRQQVRHLRADEFQAVDLDYRDAPVSLLILLPNQRDGLPALEASLSAAMLHDCAAKLAITEVDVALPRFTLTRALMLNGPLRALGMALAFSRTEADLSGINGREQPDNDALFISAVAHKAVVALDETGTQAAAATATRLEIRLGISAPPPPVPVFRADHPFLFAIRDRQSGAIVFLGRMSDPASGD